ncbi:hypothetical protein JCM11641_005823 [Rhodosporidiobolus odoratus]
MANSSNNKGKGRAQDAFERADEAERAPLLVREEDVDEEATTPRKTRLRHGRGALVREDSDDEPLNNASEDDRMRYVVVRPREGARSRIGWGGAACLFFAVFFALLLVALAAVHLWIGHLLSEQAAHGTPEHMAQRGLLWTGPSAVRLQPGENGASLVVEMDGNAGMDVRKALDWEAKETGGWLRRTEARVARWGVRKAGTVAVDVGEVALFDAASNSGPPLVGIPALDTLHIPLSYPTKNNPQPVMQSFTLRVPLDFPSPEDLTRFGQSVWESKTYRIRADVKQVLVKVGGAQTRGVSGWFMRRMSKIKVAGLTRFEEGKLPALPGASDPMSMVSNLTYNVFESSSPSHPNDTVIAISVGANLKNPLESAFQSGRLPHFAFGMPFRLPVSMHLPLPPAPQVSSNATKDVMLAKMAAAPFFFPLDSQTAKLAVSGHLVPAGNLTPSTPTPPTPPASSRLSALAPPEQPPLSRALSSFVARFLAGRTNDVYLRYDASPEPPLSSEPSSDAPFPPRVVADMLAKQVFHVQVPGTNETPDFFRNLAMKDMRIKLGGLGEGDDADLLASGEVVGEVVLPETAKKLEQGINAKAIWPDVLVYDGELPVKSVGPDTTLTSAEHSQLSFLSSDENDHPTAYPPSPIPANAFARMRPSTSMTATTHHTPANATHNSTTLVTAAFVDAPLYLLPGRGDVLRRFVAKIVFGPPGQKVKASMAGMTSVRVALSGFGEVELEEIPIEASFMVGRGGVESVHKLGDL